jgi:FkbM family methyltransferase
MDISIDKDKSSSSLDTMTHTSSDTVSQPTRLFRRAVELISQQGPSSALRRALWKMHYSRFSRRTGDPEFRKNIPDSIEFLRQKFTLHPSKEGVSEELYLYGSHEPLATRCYLESLSSGEHVLDVGSNIGYYALLAANKVGSRGRVVGCEPSPGVFEILRDNIRNSKFSNIEVFPCAVSSQRGSLEFFESEIPNWGSFFKNDELRQTRSTLVPTETVDDIVRDRPDFHPDALRMDVEGAELMVLAGAQEVLQRYKPSLFVEFHNFALGWQNVRKAIADLTKLGYQSATVIERTWDQPWMSAWIRGRRKWRGSIDRMLERVELSSDSLTNSTLIFILRA